MSLITYYPKNFRANGWGWHRSANATTAVRGFLNRERGEGSSDVEPLIGDGAGGSLYPSLPSEDDTIFNHGGARLYPALPAEEYESGAVEEVIEEACASVNVNAVDIENRVQEQKKDNENEEEAALVRFPPQHKGSMFLVPIKDGRINLRSFKSIVLGETNRVKLVDIPTIRHLIYYLVIG